MRGSVKVVLDSGASFHGSFCEPLAWVDEAYLLSMAYQSIGSSPLYKCQSTRCVTAWVWSKRKYGFNGDQVWKQLLEWFIEVMHLAAHWLLVSVCDSREVCVRYGYGMDKCKDRRFVVFWCPVNAKTTLLNSGPLNSKTAEIKLVSTMSILKTKTSPHSLQDEAFKHDQSRCSTSCL